MAYKDFYYPLSSTLADLDVPVLLNPLRNHGYDLPNNILKEKNRSLANALLLEYISQINPNELVAILKECEGVNIYEWIVDIIEQKTQTNLETLVKEHRHLLQKPDKISLFERLNNITGKLSIFNRICTLSTYKKFGNEVESLCLKTIQDPRNERQLKIANELYLRWLWADIEKNLLKKQEITIGKDERYNKMSRLLPETLYKNNCELLYYCILGSLKMFHQEDKEKSKEEAEEYFYKAGTLCYALGNCRDKGIYLYSNFNNLHYKYIQAVSTGKRPTITKMQLVEVAKSVISHHQNFDVCQGSVLWMLLKLAKLHLGLGRTCDIIDNETLLDVKSATECLHTIDSRLDLKDVLTPYCKITYFAVKSRICSLENNMDDAHKLLDHALEIANDLQYDCYSDSLQCNKQKYKSTVFEHNTE